MDVALLPSDEYKIKKFCTELIDGKYFCYYNNKTKEEYKDICNLFDIISNRLDSVGYELFKSEQDKTIYVKMQSELPIKHQSFNILKSKVVLYLFKKFLSDIKNINTGAIVYYKWNEILKDLQDTCKSVREKNEIIDTLWMLKNLNIIDINTTKKLLKKNDENDQITISIFPTIKCIFEISKLDEVEEKLETYNISRLAIEDEEDIDE